MKIKTSELIGPALDWAVAKALGILRSDTIQMYAGGPYVEGLLPSGYCPVAESAFDIPLHKIKYSTDWSQGGPIIERERLNLSPTSTDIWDCWPDFGMSDELWQRGPTPLVAAMRCFVASKLGDEVEVPEELL